MEGCKKKKNLKYRYIRVKINQKDDAYRNGKEAMGMDEELVIDGYQFSSKTEYDRAKKEKETIAYLMAHTDTADMKALLKLYHRSIEKKAFQTIIGEQFLHNLRKRLIGSQIVSAEEIPPVPLVHVGGRVVEKQDKFADAKVMRYQKLYENSVANQKIKNLLIGVLLFVIVGMFVITIQTKYSVFTYFTNYKENMKNEVINEMEDWQKQLEHREAAVKKQEQKLQNATSQPEETPSASENP